MFRALSRLYWRNWLRLIPICFDLLRVSESKDKFTLAFMRIYAHSHQIKGCRRPVNQKRINGYASAKEHERKRPTGTISGL